MSDQLPLRVSHLADASDRLGLGHCVGGGLPAWLGRPGAMVMGRAFTLQQRAVDPDNKHEALPLQHGDAAATLVAPGEILVIDVIGQTFGATWGEAHTLRAWKRGVAGVLINGLTRDIDGLRDWAFPILCRGATPLRSTGRLETVGIRHELDFLGVSINHGDTIAMDSDGFIRVRAQHVAEVMAIAQEIAQHEHKRDKQLAAFTFSQTGHT